MLYSDIKGFTCLAGSMTPRRVLWRLNNLYTRLDQQLEAFGVHKVETIGDCYVVAAGLKLGSDE